MTPGNIFTKLHFLCNLRIGQESQIVCPMQAFTVQYKVTLQPTRPICKSRRKQSVLNLSPQAQCYKTFYGRILRMFIISQSVCPRQVFQPSLMFESEARASFRHSTLRQAPGFICKHQTRLEWPARDKHSSLLRKFVNYGRKKFFNIGPRFIGQMTFGRMRDLRATRICWSTQEWKGSSFTASSTFMTTHLMIRDLSYKSFTIVIYEHL